MMGDDRMNELPDPLLAAGYASLHEETPADVEWDQLRRSIRAKAAPALARRRSRRLVAPLRPFFTLAAAAGIAAALALAPGMLERLSGVSPVTASAPAAIDPEEVLVEALGSDLTDDEFRLVVSGRAYPEALLAFAVSDP